MAKKTAVSPLSIATLDLETAMVQCCTSRSITLKPLGASASIHLGCTPLEARLAAPGQLVGVHAPRTWRSSGQQFAVGQLTNMWIDIDALQLRPLKLTDHGPVEVDESFPTDLFSAEFREAQDGLSIFEFEGLANGEGLTGTGRRSHDSGEALIDEAIATRESAPTTSRDLLMALLGQDVRCLAAHVGLGNLVFDDNPEQAIVHYGIAFELGLLSLGTEFSGLIPWGLERNRPFLCALHGYALCRWREGDIDEATDSFEYMLYLNPMDNQGARYCLEHLQNGRSWRDSL